MQLRPFGAFAALGLGLAACAPAQPPAAQATAPAAAAPAPASAPAPAHVRPQPSRTGSASERAGQGRFDATSNIPCAAAGQPMSQCAMGVAREQGGTATVVVTKPDGRKRMIFFEGGRAIGADSAQADGSAGWSFAARRQGDATLVTFGPERYEIVDAVVFGG